MIPWKFRVDKVLEINKALFHIEKTQLIFFYQLKHVLFNQLFSLANRYTSYFNRFCLFAVISTISFITTLLGTLAIKLLVL